MRFIQTTEVNLLSEKQTIILYILGIFAYRIDQNTSWEKGHVITILVYSFLLLYTAIVSSVDDSTHLLILVTCMISIGQFYLHLYSMYFNRFTHPLWNLWTLCSWITVIGIVYLDIYHDTQHWFHVALIPLLPLIWQFDSKDILDETSHFLLYNISLNYNGYERTNTKVH